MRRLLLAATLVAAATILGLSGPALAGQSVEVSCSSPSCRYTAIVGFGGGLRFEQRVGYCVQCRAFASVSWTRGRPAVSPGGRVWLPATGETVPVYSCPKCRGPFVSLGSAADLKRCPRCGRASIRSRLRALYD